MGNLQERPGDHRFRAFGPVVRKITERADTIEAFNKAIAAVEGNSSQKTNTSSCFLCNHPTGKYGGRSDRSPTPHTNSDNQEGKGKQQTATHKTSSRRVRPQVVNTSMTVGGNLQQHMHTEEPVVVR